MNEAYRMLLDARVEAAVIIAKAYAKVKHKLLKGELREIVVRDLLRPFFPSDVGLGTGEIVSAVEGAGHSGQQDVILFDRRILPPLLADEKAGIFPVESVIATLEIKSLLNVEELKKAHVNAQSVRRLEMQPGVPEKKDQPTEAESIPRLTCLLAFDTDLVQGEKEEIKRYEEIRDGRYAVAPEKEEGAKGRPAILIPKNDPPTIMILCVVGRGLWYWQYNKKSWMRLAATKPFDEVAGLITMLGNSYKNISALRGHPPIGRYLFPIGHQIFDEIPFEELYPELVKKANASAAAMWEQVKEKHASKNAPSPKDEGSSG